MGVKRGTRKWGCHLVEGVFSQWSQERCTKGVTICSDECVPMESKEGFGGSVSTEEFGPRGVKGGSRGLGYQPVGGLYPQGCHGRYSEGFPSCRRS